MDIMTKYGLLADCQETTYHQNGSLASAFAHETSVISTSAGKLHLAHDFSSPRRKYIPSAKFDPDGLLQAANLAEQTKIETTLGDFYCEYLTFYPSGAPCRLFHLNGKLGGYWSEQQDTELAKITEITLPCGLIKAKIMTLHFYETGEIASVTFFPGTLVSVKTSHGLLKTRIGISFYQNGTLKSIEPAAPLTITTPIGSISAFDTEPIGVTGDLNSLVWDQTGKLCSCKTTDALSLKFVNGSVRKIKPSHKLSLCSDDVMVNVPYTISWNEGNVYIKNIDSECIVYDRLELT